jgi:hypothetical protein
MQFRPDNSVPARTGKKCTIGDQTRKKLRYGEIQCCPLIFGHRAHTATPVTGITPFDPICSFLDVYLLKPSITNEMTAVPKFVSAMSDY